jgi:hypothetical protein
MDPAPIAAENAFSATVGDFAPQISSWTLRLCLANADKCDKIKMAFFDLGGD